MGKRMELTPNQKLFTSKGIKTSWTYIGEVEIRKYGKTYRRIIEVMCECGRTKEVQLNNVMSGRSVCCGFNPCKIPHNKNNRNPETTYNSLYYAYTKGALKRGLTFELTKDQFKSFLHLNCDYCGSEPSNVYEIKNSKTGEIRAGVRLVYNGIDRIDNNVGYVYNNCISCCGTCNGMKHAHGSEFFLHHIKKIFMNKFA